MKIKIEDDYDKSDFEKFNITVDDSKDKYDNNDILAGNIVEANFQEVVSDKEDYSKDSLKEYYNDYKNYYSNYEYHEVDCEDSEILGKITVISRLANKNRTLISAAKINLYVLNGVSPKLVESKCTDNNGQVVFENLKKGSYRVIAIVNRKYFEKPTYCPWNEVTIDKSTKETVIEVVNKIKSV